MKKGFTYYASIWVVLFIVFNLLCFATPNEMNGMYKYGGAFWAGYVFIVIAMISELICGYVAFGAGNRQKFYYNIPLIKKSYSFMILMMIVGTACMIIPDFPNWFAAIVCGVLLVLNVLSLMKARAGAEIIGEKDDVVNAKTLFIKSLTMDVELLMKSASTDETKVMSKKVYEAVRYSDPMSSDGLSSIETEITLRFVAFKEAIEQNNPEYEKIGNELLVLISERNKKCRLIK